MPLVSDPSPGAVLDPPPAPINEDPGPITAPVSGTLVPASDPVPVRWVFALASLVCLAAVVTVIYDVLRPQPLNRAQYGFVAALLCFALSTIAGLLFASKVNFEATLGFFTASIVGPAALWLVALLVFVKVVPPPDIGISPLALQRLESFARELDSSTGWSSFEDWKTELGPLRTVLEGEEESNIKHLLNASFITGAGQRKLREPSIETLFVFPKNPDSGTRRAVKFQRITGNAKTGREAVYLTASPTGMDGSVQSYFFALSPGGSLLEPRALTNAADWYGVGAGMFDGILVAFYQDKGALPGDWLQVQTPKYVEAEDRANVVLGLTAASSLATTKEAFWEMRSATFAAQGLIPLLFQHREDGNGLLGGKGFSRGFARWLTDLDLVAVGSSGGASDSWRQARAFLGQVRSSLYHGLPAGGCAGILEATAYPRHITHKFEGQVNPVLLTFLWGTPQPEPSPSAGAEPSAAPAQAAPSTAVQ